jgi:hypothetical protein
LGDTQLLTRVTFQQKWQTAKNQQVNSVI